MDPQPLDANSLVLYMIHAVKSHLINFEVSVSDSIYSDN